MVITQFVPYSLQDLDVIIRHSSKFPLRWEWFWPRFVAVTPQEVLKNTVVAYHNQHGEGHVIPENVRIVEDIGQISVFCDQQRNVTGPFLQALQLCHTRLIARVDDDLKLKQGWAQDVVSLFNEEPHFKMLGRFVSPAYSTIPLKEEHSWPWLRELLGREENAEGWGFFAGALIITNRALWLAYYPSVDQEASGGGEDKYFSLFARADGVHAQPIDKHYGHHGFRYGKDGIEQGPE